jgi:DNA repair protein RadC
MSQSVLNDGHRARLRRRFAQDPLTLSPEELLELLLTYAIPRQDVGPQAHALLERFGDIAAVLAASHCDLTAVAGIGDQATTLLALVRQLVQAGPAAGQQNLEQPLGRIDRPTLRDVGLRRLHACRNPAHPGRRVVLRRLAG